MHSYTDRLQILVSGESDSILEKLTVRAADQSVFVAVALGAFALRVCVQISGQKMEG